MKYPLLRSFSIIYQNTRIPTITKLSAALAKHCESLSNHFTWQRYLFFHLLSTHRLLCISSWRTTEESAVGYRLCLHQLKCFWFQEREKGKVTNKPHKEATVWEALSGQKQSHHHQESWSFMKIKSVERWSKANLFVPIFETFWKIPPTLSVSLEVFLGVCFWVSKDNLVLANKTCITVS